MWRWVLAMQQYGKVVAPVRHKYVAQNERVKKAEEEQKGIEEQEKEKPKEEMKVRAISCNGSIKHVKRA